MALRLAQNILISFALLFSFRCLNSGVNIAKRDNLLSGSDYVGWILSKPTYTAKWNLTNGKVLLQVAQPSN